MASAADVTSDVDRPSGNGECRLLHRLGEAGMAMTGTGQVFGRAAELHRDDDFLDQIAGFRADDMGAENAIALSIRQKS